MAGDQQLLKTLKRQNNSMKEWLWRLRAHAVCSSANWQDPHRKTMRKVKKTSFYVTQTSHFHSHGAMQKWAARGCTCWLITIDRGTGTAPTASKTAALISALLQKPERWEMQNVFLPPPSLCALVLACWESCLDVGANLNGTSWSDSDSHANRITRHDSGSL